MFKRFLFGERLLEAFAWSVFGVSTPCLVKLGGRPGGSMGGRLEEVIGVSRVLILQHGVVEGWSIWCSIGHYGFSSTTKLTLDPEGLLPAITLARRVRSSLHLEAFWAFLVGLGHTKVSQSGLSIRAKVVMLTCGAESLYGAQVLVLRGDRRVLGLVKVVTDLLD